MRGLHPVETVIPNNGLCRWEVCWWALQDLNLGPMDYESTALTAELRARIGQSSTTETKGFASDSEQD